MTRFTFAAALVVLAVYGCAETMTAPENNIYYGAPKSDQRPVYIAPAHWWDR